MARFEPNFSITPVKGYISSGMEVPFEITFHPTQVANDIRVEVCTDRISGIALFVAKYSNIILIKH